MRRSLWCDGLIVKRFPVTNRQYIAFLDDLVDEFGELDDVSANAKIDAFKPHWEKLRDLSRQADTAGSRRRRSSTV